jgi:tRNA (cytidine/uridine-2'-O-)-methyltransferase
VPLNNIHVVLYQPEIPPNTGNIIRLCANTGTNLHLVHPLGFALDDTRLQRAGLDYHEWAVITQHDSIEDFYRHILPQKIYAVSTRGHCNYTDADFSDENTIALLFGPETRGLPLTILDSFDKKNILRIPMQHHSRSLNLSNAVAVVVYEALRQLNFKNLSR